MKDYELLDAIGGIDAAYVDAADRPADPKKRSYRSRWIAVAACLFLVAAASFGALQLGLLGGKAGAGNQGKEGIAYMSYAGPVFPLSAADSDPDITVERNVDFDFSPYNSRIETYEDENNDTVSYEAYDSRSIITDSYTLRNSSGEAKTLTLLYPFAASLGDRAEVKPVITVNGIGTEPTCHIGPYSGTFTGAIGDPGDESTVNLSEISSWEGYKALIESGYLPYAFDGFPALDQPVVVYELRDRYGKESDEAQAPTLNMEFSIDYRRTTILTYGFNRTAFDMDTGYCARGTHVPQPGNPDYGESAFLLVLGDDIGEYELNAYINGACETSLENAGAEVIRYESTLDKIFAQLAEMYLSSYDPMLFGGSDGSLLSTITKEEYLGLASELMYSYGLLAENPMDRYSEGILEDIFSETRSAGRIMYLTLPVTIPGNGSVTLTAKMEKPASRDFFGKSIRRNGYDMVTQLGSGLSFAAQTASVTNAESIEIIRQNFGFDLLNGITHVELDLNEPHYYLDVQKKAA